MEAKGVGTVDHAARLGLPDEARRRFSSVEPVAEGGMGLVYRAHDDRLERDVALKVVHGRYIATDDDGRRAMFEARFGRELHALAALSHPNVIGVFDVIESQVGRVIVLEYLGGDDLDELLRDGPLSIERTASIMDQALDALAAVHAAAIVHRDIKPANLRVLGDGTVKLMDFGLISLEDQDRTKLTESGEFLGTLPYIPPEVCRGQRHGPVGDVFQMGLVLFECLTGAYPYTKEQIFARVAGNPVVPPRWPAEQNPDVSEALDAVVRKAMALQPSERYQSADEFRTAIVDAVNPGERTAAVSPQPRPGGRSERRRAVEVRARRHRLVVLVVSVAVLGLLVLDVLLSLAPTASCRLVGIEVSVEGETIRYHARTTPPCPLEFDVRPPGLVVRPSSDGGVVVRTSGAKVPDTVRIAVRFPDGTTSLPLAVPVRSPLSRPSFVRDDDGLACRWNATTDLSCVVEGPAGVRPVRRIGDGLTVTVPAVWFATSVTVVSTLRPRPDVTISHRCRLTVPDMVADLVAPVASLSRARELFDHRRLDERVPWEPPLPAGSFGEAVEGVVALAPALRAFFAVEDEATFAVRNAVYGRLLDLRLLTFLPGGQSTLKSGSVAALDGALANHTNVRILARGEYEAMVARLRPVVTCTPFVTLKPWNLNERAIAEQVALSPVPVSTMHLKDEVVANVSAPNGSRPVTVVVATARRTRYTVLWVEVGDGFTVAVPSDTPMLVDTWLGALDEATDEERRERMMRSYPVEHVAFDIPAALFRTGRAVPIRVRHMVPDTYIHFYPILLGIEAGSSS